MNLHAHIRRSPSSCSVALAFITAVAIAPARASEFDAVDIAFEALQAGGAAVGVTITEDEKRFLKPLVHCLADNPNSPGVSVPKPAPPPLPACKSYEIRGGDGKCYVDSGGVR